MSAGGSQFAPRTINVGERHGRLVVARVRLPGDSHVVCRCDCGTDRVVRFSAWGRTQSCGCLKAEAARANLGPTRRPCERPGHEREPLPGHPNATRCKTCARAVHRGLMKQKHADLRARVLAAYGGACACCGEREEVFLTVDHVNGDGAAHRLALAKGRRRQGSGTLVYRDICDRGFPPDFQILCFNCNYAKHRLGRCPHGEGLRELARWTIDGLRSGNDGGEHGA